MPQKKRKRPEPPRHKDTKKTTPRKVAKKKRAPKKPAAKNSKNGNGHPPQSPLGKGGSKGTAVNTPPTSGDVTSVDHGDNQSDGVAVQPGDLVDLPVPGNGNGASPLVESQIRTLVTALEKQQRGEALGRDETRIVTKWHKQQEERLRKEYYASIPQKHWREMSGRGAKVINEQAQLYGIPFDGATVCLGDVVKSLHDMFADRTLQRTVSTDPDDPDGLFTGSGGGDSHWMEQCRKEKAKILRLQRQEREKNLIPRETILESLNQMAQLLRDAGIRVQKKYGADAYEIIKQANDGFQMQIHHALGEAAQPP